MGIEKQGAKPSGLLGKMIGRLMNVGHTKLYINYFDKKDIPDNSRILDIGCGGGKFLKYLSSKSKSYQLYGIDHSIEMINLTKQINLEALKQNQLKLHNGSVSNIPFKKNSFDIITAFETIQFWPKLDNALNEILKVLDKDGEFIIINHFPKEGSKWWKLATLKSEKDYYTTMKKAGFNNIKIDFHFKKGWIVASGIK